LFYEEAKLALEQVKYVQMVYPRFRKSLPKLQAFVDFVADRLGVTG
jgi:hypothetical protein